MKNLQASFQGFVFTKNGSSSHIISKGFNYCLGTLISRKYFKDCFFDVPFGFLLCVIDFLEREFLKLKNKCTFTKSNTLPWIFFTFLKLYKWFQIAHLTAQL